MKKVISFSLWGDNTKYCEGALSNVALRDKFYPDWYCYFYVHHEVPKFYIEALQKLPRVKVIVSYDEADWRFTTLRFVAIDDSDVSHVIFRDTDSRLNAREAAAVEEWIAQDKAIHVMKDHPYHGSFPILAGMWGLNKSKFPYRMNQALWDYAMHRVETQYHYDQIFLQHYLWEGYKGDATIHDEFFLKLPFPTKRDGFQFVGQSFNENDETPLEHIDALIDHL